MSKILDQIRQAILSSGKTQYRISVETKISRSRLSKLMKGKLGLSIEALEELAEYLGLEITIHPKKKG
jgi:predicted XRE-type DNA-binding protein